MMFGPQIILVVSISYSLYQDLLFAMLLQTWCFVNFNQFSTEKHFLLYLSLFPLVAVNNAIIHKWYGSIAISFLVIHYIIQISQTLHRFVFDQMGLNNLAEI